MHQREIVYFVHRIAQHVKIRYVLSVLMATMLVLGHALLALLNASLVMILQLAFYVQMDM